MPGGATNSKVKLWTDSEGGNLGLLSPNGNHVQMDMFDNEHIRIYAGTPSQEMTGEVIWDKTTTVNLTDLDALSKRFTLVNVNDIVYDRDNAQNLFTIRIRLDQTTLLAIIFDPVYIYYKASVDNGATWHEYWKK